MPQPPVAELFRSAGPSARLLAPDEPAPFAFVQLSGKTPALLVCDHAASFIPRALGRLGLDAADLARHIAWDIGIAEVTGELARRLDVPAVLSGFSRLAIDPNRHLASRGSIPEISDGTAVPGNRRLDAEARRARVESLFKPYHAAVARMIEALIAAGRPPVLIFMHSFTPVMEGFERPWEIGVLWDGDPRLPRPLIAALRAKGLTVGDNEPYSGASPEDYSLHAHAEARGLPSVLVEIRQDLIDTHHGAAQWAGTMAEVLAPLVARPASIASPAALAETAGAETAR